MIRGYDGTLVKRIYVRGCNILLLAPRPIFECLRYSSVNLFGFSVESGMSWTSPPGGRQPAARFPCVFSIPFGRKLQRLSCPALASFNGVPAGFLWRSWLFMADMAHVIQGSGGPPQLSPNAVQNPWTIWPILICCGVTENHPRIIGTHPPALVGTAMGLPRPFDVMRPPGKRRISKYYPGNPK
jgi:hypothetical protein